MSFVAKAADRDLGRLENRFAARSGRHEPSDRPVSVRNLDLGAPFDGP